MKKYWVVFGMLLFVLLTACSIDGNAKPDNAIKKESERFPYKSLKAEEIKEVKIHVVPPDREIKLTGEQVSECVEILRKLELEERVASEHLLGQMIKVVITAKDGTRTEIQDMSPYLVMDGVWYKAKGYGEELNTFANEIIASTGA